MCLLAPAGASGGALEAPVPAEKHIDWYCGTCSEQFALNATVGQPDLVDGILPCCNLLEIDCSTGTINVSRLNFSGYASFVNAGKTVNIDLSGEAACCANTTDCTIWANRTKLAAQLLELATLYNLSGYTMDWEFGDAWNYAGYNQTMAYIAGVLRPHGIGLGISIDNGCENEAYVGGADPTCCPAYRNVPWAAVLTDMGTYSPGQLRTVGGTGKDGMGWSKNGSRGSCDANTVNDPAVIQYCGFAGNVMNMLHSPVATVHTDRWPMLSPAIWIGECFKNGSGTEEGWTQAKLAAFLSFLDSVQVQSIGIWCMAEMGCSNILSGNLSKGQVYCPWMYDELRAWRHRPIGGGGPSLDL